MLAAHALSIGNAGRIIGQDINLGIAPGEIVCLLGPNGCGKTTLFKTLLGLIPSLAGKVEVEGANIAALPRAALARRVAYVPQASHVYFPFSVLDIVLMGRINHMGPFSPPSRADHAAAHSALATLGISQLGQRSISEISGGERQLALIARALAQDPKILVMDEPTASLDFGNQANVLACISRLASLGLAVLLSTHDPSHALACAGRTALMKSGKIVASGPTRSVVTSGNLREIYGIEVVVAEIEGAGHSVCVPVIQLEKEKLAHETQRA